ncbi:MAG: methyltransferase domain-containing protein [Acidobacteriota bacterium]
MLTPKRIESEELLDEGDVTAEDRERSLRDLRRINKYLGGVRVYRSLVRAFAPRSILDLGTGTSDLLEAVPGVPLRIGLDFNIEHLLYLRTASRVHRVVGDVHHLPFRGDAVDLITSSHFFHHFSPDENEAIMTDSLRIARKGVAFTDTERHYVPLLVTTLLGALRLVGRVTRFDAPASVRQGYTAREVRALASRIGASRWKVMLKWPFRFAILLWR